MKMYIQRNDEGRTMEYYSSKTRAVKNLVSTLESYCEGAFKTSVVDQKVYTYVAVRDEKMETTYIGTVATQELL